MLTSKKKNILNVLFLLVVFGLTVFSIFHGEDLHNVIRTLWKVNKWYLIPGIACVVFFIWGESIIIYYLMGTLRIPVKKRTCFMYSCIGFFFSCITPSASGGQPAQIYYMRKDKIPIPISTLVLMIVTITYKLVLVVTGLFLLIFQRGFVLRYLGNIMPVFYLGIGLNVVCCVVMILLVFHPALAKTMMLRCLSGLEKIHILKKKQERREKLERSMNQYNATAIYLKEHSTVILNVFVITFIQRFALFLVTYFVYKACGLRGSRGYDIVMLQAVISVSVDMLPLPGGMGISENLFLVIFKHIFKGGFVLVGMLLSRGIAYYVQLLLSAGVTVFAHFRADKKTM